MSPVARGQMEEAILVELQVQIGLLACEGASAAESRREEGPSTRDANVEVTATLGEDPKRNRHSRARGVGSILESRAGGLTSHTMQRPSLRVKKERVLRSHPRNS